MRALPHLLQRLRRALWLQHLRGRQTQLLRAVSTLEQCIQHDQALIADLRRELQVIEARLASATQPLTLWRAPL